jgi:hypothetical protein
MRAWAHFIGFRSDGTFLPAEPLPTLFDLGDRPKPCTPADRAGSPRFPVLFSGDGERPFFPGMRHPVLVNEPRSRAAVGVDAPLALLTSDAVVHGTPASPCVAAWAATGVGKGSPMGAVLPGDLSRAWLFRYTTEPAHPGKRGEPAAAASAVEYRPMNCRFDPAARIPEAIWNEPGTAHP